MKCCHEKLYHLVKDTFSTSHVLTTRHHLIRHVFSERYLFYKAQLIGHVFTIRHIYFENLPTQLSPNATAADHLYSLSLKTLEQKQVEYLFCLRINNTKNKQIAREKISAGLVGCARPLQWCNARATLESPGSKLPQRALRLKMVNLISCEPLAHISDIKLIRTDTVSEMLHLIFANRPRKVWVLSLCSCFLYIQLTASSFLS